MLKKETVFTSLYDAYWEKIVKLCLAYTGDFEQAKDLAQESFLKAWNNLESFKEESSAGTWLYRIAVNTCLVHLRTAKRMPSVELTEVKEFQLSSSAEDFEKIKLLYTVISKLPEIERLIITLVLEEVPYEEIGDILNISQGNLRVRIHRAKQTLTELFNKYE